MTLVDLNSIEIMFILTILKIEKERLKFKPDRGKMETKQKLKEWANHIQSIIYKLEKAIEK